MASNPPSPSHAPHTKTIIEFGIGFLGLLATVLTLSDRRLHLVAAAGVLVLCGAFSLPALRGLHGKKYRDGVIAVAISLLAAVLAYLIMEGSSISAPTADATSGPARVALQVVVDPIPRDTSAGGVIPIGGRVTASIPGGSTLWVVASHPLAGEQGELLYLQPGPCIIDAANHFQCLHVRIGGPGTWNFNVVLAGSEGTNTLVQLRLAGQHVDDKGLSDSNPRNFVSLPNDTMSVALVTATLA